MSGRFRAVWEGDWKLIWTPFEDSGREYRLYNIAQDPHERTDLAAKHPDKVEALSKLLESWLRDGDSAPVALELDAAEKQRLKSLGYIGG